MGPDMEDIMEARKNRLKRLDRETKRIKQEEKRKANRKMMKEAGLWSSKRAKRKLKNTIKAENAEGSNLREHIDEWREQLRRLFKLKIFTDMYKGEEGRLILRKWEKDWFEFDVVPDDTTFLF